MLGTYIHTNQKPKVTVDDRTEPVQEQPKIKVLINSSHYFLDFVYLLLEENGVYLVYFNPCQGPYFNKKYQTEKGAKIAFYRRCGKRASKHNTKPNWTHKYPPEKSWLEDRANNEPFYYQGMHSLK